MLDLPAPSRFTHMHTHHPHTAGLALRHACWHRVNPSLRSLVYLSYFYFYFYCPRRPETLPQFDVFQCMKLARQLLRRTGHLGLGTDTCMGDTQMGFCFSVLLVDSNNGQNGHLKSVEAFIVPSQFVKTKLH